MSADPWLSTQVRTRAARLIGADWAERVYIRCIVDELECEGIADVRHMPADELDALIIKHTDAPIDDIEDESA